MEQPANNLSLERSFTRIFIDAHGHTFGLHAFDLLLAVGVGEVAAACSGAVSMKFNFDAGLLVFSLTEILEVACIFC